MWNSTLFGGPSQPEPTDDRGGIRAAQKLGQTTASAVNPNQYENDDVSISFKREEEVEPDLGCLELEIARQVDRTPNSEAAARDFSHLRWHGHVWYYDGPRNLFQAEQAICLPTWVCCRA